MTFDLLPLKCSSCGAPLEVTKYASGAKCSYCGTNFRVSEKTITPEPKPLVSSAQNISAPFPKLDPTTEFHRQLTENSIHFYEFQRRRRNRSSDYIYYAFAFLFPIVALVCFGPKGFYPDTGYELATLISGVIFIVVLPFFKYYRT